MDSIAIDVLRPPVRSEKPRRRGLTSMIDFGPDGFGWTGPRGVADLLDCASGYIDYAKIYALDALLLPGPVIAEIVRLYRDAGVTPYSGGILFEHAYRRNELDLFVALLKRIGIPMLEISENYVTLSDAERTAFIDRFQREGLSVIYEFGRKNPEEPMDVDRIEEIVVSAVDSGVEHIILEQSEIDLAVRDAPERLNELAGRSWFERILIEADPYRFPKQHVELINQFGPEVSLANVAPGQVFRLEGLRRGIGRAVNYSMFAESLS